MATAWDVPTVGWTVIVMGWLLSPIFTLLAPKILSYLGFELEQKLRERKSKIIPELQETLGKVDQARMMQRGEVPHVSTLDDMAAWLRHAVEDADDILDDVQEKIVVADILNGWCMGVARIVQRGFLWLFFPIALETLKADLTKISLEVHRLLLLGNWASGMSPVDTLMTVPKTLRADMLKTILELRRRRLQDIGRDNFLCSIYILLSLGQPEPAQEEAEDIVDKMVEWLRLAEEEDILHQTCIDRFNRSCLGIARIVQRGFLWLFFPIPLETLKADLTKISLEVHRLLLLGNWASGMSPVDTLMTVPKTLRADMLKTILELRRRRLQDIGRDNFLCSIYILLSTGGLLSRIPFEPAQEEVEDIVDKMVEWLRQAEEEDKMVRSGSSPLRQGIVSEGALPMRRIVVAPSTTSRGDSTPSDSSGWWLSCWCSSVHFKKCCSSIFYWLVHAIEVARSCRDESYKKVGITINQENASMLDLLPTAISRRNLKKRIEKVESTVNLVKGSPLLSVATESKPNDIANKNKCQVRTDSIKPNDIANKNRCQVRADSNRKVFGREKLRDDIMAKLRETPHGDAPGSSTSPCYSVIGIYGISGSGKTTFARFIQDYIQKGCQEKLFDTVMCIHVSKTFSVDAIFHEMLKDITEDSHSNISDRANLKKKLKESLRDKRFFLILDDLWVKTRNDPQLEELISPLNAGLKGSKILVTAQTKDAPGALCADELIEMPDLDEDQYLEMFMHYALGGRSVDVKQFEQVGREIAKKLHRSPIAAAIVGGRLGTNLDIRFWKNSAKLDLSNEIMDALWWSYQQLNPDIRRCFEFCNIFPRRFKLSKDELVHLWIAQGFVESGSKTDDMEDVAERYIQELVSCSFLQPNSPHNFDWFTIHDRLHDLVDKVVGNDYFRIENEKSQSGEGWKGDVPQHVRHLFVQNYDAEFITEKILGLENLRTLIIDVVGKDTPVEEKVIESICKRLPKLRVLAIAFRDEINEPKKFSFPEYISQLKHLRYLAFRMCYCTTVILPSTLNKLHHIQVLDFGSQSEILKLTSVSVISLRHIICKTMRFPDIGRLTSLETIPDFIVRNEQGYEVKQLRYLNKLHGNLWIWGLENVRSKKEALEANLATKERLTELTLNWGGDCSTRCSPEVEADVLEGLLCRFVGLEKLTIRGYKGSSHPDWMVGKHNGGPKHLQILKFNGCGQLEPAPELQAFPHLHFLWLLDCKWDALPGNMEHLTLMKHLAICQCVNIRSLPTLPQSLETFLISDCDYEFMKSCQTVGHPNWQKIEHIPKKTFPRTPLISQEDDDVANMIWAARRECAAREDAWLTT